MSYVKLALAALPSAAFFAAAVFFMAAASTIRQPWSIAGTMPPPSGVTQLSIQLVPSGELRIWYGYSLRQFNVEPGGVKSRWAVQLPSFRVAHTVSDRKSSDGKPFLSYTNFRFDTSLCWLLAFGLMPLILVTHRGRQLAEPLRRWAFGGPRHRGFEVNRPEGS